MKIGEKFALTLLIVPALFLASCSCEWFKEKFSSKSESAAIPDKSEVIVSMKGKPVITVDSFEREFDQLIEENPQLKQVLVLMPDAKKNFLQGMVNQEVVDFWVAENNIVEKESYKKEYERMMKSVRRMLNTKYFGLEHPVQLSEVEVKEFYEKNKDSMPDLMISRGGVQACGVSFEKETDARAFLTKAKELKDLKKAADGAKLSKNFKDFKLVNAQSLGMDGTLRDKIVALETVPYLDVVKVSDKSFWVVNATSKEETKYRPFEQVKAGLEQYVSKEKRMEIFDKEITKLKTDYSVVVNDEVLKAKQETAVAQNELAVPTSPEVAVAQTASPSETARAEEGDTQAAMPETAKAA